MTTRLTELLGSARICLLTWLLSRVALVIVYAFAERGVVHDVAYYHTSLEQLGGNGLDHTLVEYPVPAVALLWVPDRLADALGHPRLYAYLCALLILALDAIFMVALTAHRRSDEHRAIAPAELAWIVALPALGATSLARFDLVPGALVGLALLYAPRHPRIAGSLVALATSVKYWPAVIIPGFLARRRTRAATFAAIALTGLTIALVSLLASSAGRLTSPLTYQSARGLQIESIAATPAMIGWAFGGGSRWQVFHSTASKSYEISGPWISELETLSTLLTLGAAVVLVALWWRASVELRVHESASDGESPLAWLTLSAIVLFIISSKVFSPQYVLWVLPAGVAAIATVRGDDARRAAQRWTWTLLGLALLTQIIFPIGYWHLDHPDGLSPVMAAVLAIRNIGFVALSGTAVAHALGIRLDRWPHRFPASFSHPRPRRG